MSIDLSEFSIAHWFPEQEQHRCGYCKHTSGSISFGMLAEVLTVEEYKHLIDRGWRRSGAYCYKPVMDKTCCPQYTIRCHASEFKLNKSHKKLIKKFNKFLNDGILKKSQVAEQQDTIDDIDIPSSTTTVQANKKILSGTGPDPNKPPCKKAKFIRLEKKQQKFQQKPCEAKPIAPQNIQKTLTELIDDFASASKHKIKFKLIPTSKPGAEWEAVKQTEFNLYCKYQTIVHNDDADHLSMKSFTRFLVSSPLKPKPFPNGIEGPGYGSFHQQYWIDDQLIAVGVIDILPECVSSVYFFYDPDYRDLTLGTYGSLREIQFVQNLQRQVPDIKYYYMGFYIHSCPKMRYKGQLSPSYLLCPETYIWVAIEKALIKLNQNKYACLNDNLSAVDLNAPSETDVNLIKIIYNHRLMLVRDYLRLNKEDKDMLKQLGNLIGKQSINNIIFAIAI